MSSDKLTLCLCSLNESYKKIIWEKFFFVKILQRAAFTTVCFSSHLYSNLSYSSYLSMSPHFSAVSCLCVYGSQDYRWWQMIKTHSGWGFLGVDHWLRLSRCFLRRLYLSNTGVCFSSDIWSGQGRCKCSINIKMCLWHNAKHKEAEHKSAQIALGITARKKLRRKKPQKVFFVLIFVLLRLLAAYILWYWLLA